MKYILPIILFVVLGFAPHLISRIFITRKFGKKIIMAHVIFYLLNTIFFFFVILYGLRNPNPSIDKLLLVVFGFFPYLIFDGLLFYKIAKHKLQLEQDMINQKVYAFVTTSGIIFIIEIVICFVLLIQLASHY